MDKEREGFTERRTSANETDELGVHPSKLTIFLSKVIREQSEWVEGSDNLVVPLSSLSHSLYFVRSLRVALPTNSLISADTSGNPGTVKGPYR